MTQHHHSNGNVAIQKRHSRNNSLEESIMSLISSQDLSSSSVLLDESTSLKTSYRKAAKLFVNKKFKESYEIINGLIDQSMRLFDETRIDSEIYVNIWSLYFNLIDIFINEGDKSLSNSELNEISDLFYGEELFTQLFSLNEITPPKLILLLSLIKLNNDKTDFLKLREQLDVYLNYASKLDDIKNSEEYQELLEIYYVHLLVKLNKLQESEYSIQNDPNVKDPEAMIQRMKDNKIKLDEDIKKKKLLEKQKRQRQKKKQEKLRERELKEERNRQNQSEGNKLSEPQLDEYEDVEDTTDNEKSDLIMVLQLIKKKFWFLNLKSTPVIVLSILMIIIFGQSKFINTTRLKQNAQSFWNKFTTTLKMAFQVTYV